MILLVPGPALDGLAAVAAPPRLIAIVGPTASGKSALALRLARERGGGDRLLRQPAGVPRPRHRQRQADRRRSARAVPHHLIDVVDPDQDFSAADYARLARAARRGHRGARARCPIVAGGTGLYLRALLHGLFEGPARDEPLRAPAGARSPTAAATRACTGCSRRVDPESRRAHRAARPRARGARARGLPRDRPAARRAPPRGRGAARGVPTCCVLGLDPPRDALRAAVERADRRDARARACSRRRAALLARLRAGRCGRCRRSATARRSRWCAATRTVDAGAA